MKELVVILTHADNEQRVQVLKECTQELKAQGHDILISSHIEIPSDLYNQINYFIYDKDNALIRLDEFKDTGSTVFITTHLADFTLNYPIEYNHAYAVLKLIKNAYAIADIENYDIIHFVNYDYVLKQAGIISKHSIYLQEFDVVSYNWEGHGAPDSFHISSAFFSVKVKSIASIIREINNKRDYCTKGHPIFENYLYKIFTASDLKVKYLPIADILNDVNKIATCSILDDVFIDTENGNLDIIPAKDLHGDCYLVIKHSVDLNVDLNIDGLCFSTETLANIPNMISVPTDFNKIEIFSQKYNIKREVTSKSSLAYVEHGTFCNKITLSNFKKQEYSIEKYLDDKAIKRWDVINFLIEQHSFKDYLEIGVDSGLCIRKINIQNKDGVDPNPGLESGGEYVPEVNYPMTSDSFFELLSERHKRYDVIFIDGLHHSDQVDKDIENSLDRLNEGGFIILHDCNPPQEDIQIIPRQTGIWTGDVWKSIAKLRCTRPDLEVCVIDADWGIGIVRKGQQVVYDKNKYEDCLNYSYLDKNREDLLNIISTESFFTKYKNKK